MSTQLNLSEVRLELNKQRTEKGRLCIAAHKGQIENLRYDPQEDDLIDAVTDMMHFIHSRGVNVAAIVGCAQGHFEEETA